MYKSLLSDKYCCKEDSQPTINLKRIPQSNTPKGAFGKVFFARWDKKKLAIKQYKSHWKTSEYMRNNIKLRDLLTKEHHDRRTAFFVTILGCIERKWTKQPSDISTKLACLVILADGQDCFNHLRDCSTHVSLDLNALHHNIAQAISFS